MRWKSIFLEGFIILFLICAQAGAKSLTIRGIVHDPQHRPIPGATVTLSGVRSKSLQATQSNPEGEFKFRQVPAGDYTISVKASGFALLKQPLQVNSKNLGILHLQMALASVAQEVQVSGATARLNTQSSTTSTTISKQEITRTPGADLTNSLAMITDFVPGAYVVHDMLHVRGGHQESWFFDGIPVINTNIASNVGPVVDPKDIESLEAETGGYSSEYGDRTFGFFNVVTPSGFDRNNEGDLILSYGNFNQTDDAVNFGGHTERLAYYASLNGNRSDLGLMNPDPQVIHDAENGLGGMASLLYNATPNDQLRVVGSARDDHYQIPNTPEQQATGIRDTDLEHDAFLGLEWAHTFSNQFLLTVSPFLHSNTAQYAGGPGDTPFILNQSRASTYQGALISLAGTTRKNQVRVGVEFWGQQDNAHFNLTASSGGAAFAEQLHPSGNSEAFYAEDRYRLTSWLSLNGGIRLNHYSGLLSENAADPRLGAALRIPKLNWVLRGYYAYTFQPPPLDTLSGPGLSFAQGQGYSFLPLHSERDIQRDFGVSIPLRGWTLDADNFHTDAQNFLDHDEIGNSDIFLPLTIQSALIRGTEVALSSPRLFSRARLRLVYSNQIAQGLGTVTGGLTDFIPPTPGYFFLDHDQRNTANSVLTFDLPKRSWVSAVVSYGSGFLNGNGPSHLPAYTTADFSLGKSWGKRWSVSFNALNATNSRFMLDNSNTFGGTHFINPRQIDVEIRRHFSF